MKRKGESLDQKRPKRKTKEFDSHVETVLTRPANGELELRIGPGLTDSWAAAASNGNSSVLFRNGSGAGTGAGAGGAASTGQTTTGASTTPGVFRVGNGVSPPSVLSRVDPVFPEEAGTDKAAGTVILSCVIGAAGRAQEIRVVKSNGAGFDANAIAALSKWLFKPGMLNGVPVQVRATVEVNFRKS
jgi:protein TonB